MTSSYGQIRGGGELLEASPVAHAWARVQRGGQFAHPRRMRAGDSLTPSKLRLGRFDRAGFSFFFSSAGLLAKAKFVWRRAALPRPGQDMH
jgi:hypothetical protein